MFPHEVDENYYDVEGEKICDKTGRCMYVNDGHSIYNVETSDAYEDMSEETNETNVIIENECISLLMNLIYCSLMVLTKVFNCFYNTLKNRNE